MPGGLIDFVENSRSALNSDSTHQRNVYVSDIKKAHNGVALSLYVADKAPLFYRRIKNIVDRLAEGFFLTALRETLAKLPEVESFRSSHCGEILAGIFAEEVLGLRKLYSKLSLLTAENSNAYKMDLVLCNANADPIEFVFGQVKSSPKTSADGISAGHHKSCYPDLFASMNNYLETDLSFDLTAARDNLDEFEEPLRSTIKDALKPYTDTKVRYAAFAVIDLSTKDLSEASLLATRKNDKEFDVDVLCVADYAEVATAAYEKLANLECSLQTKSAT